MFWPKSGQIAEILIISYYWNIFAGVAIIRKAKTQSVWWNKSSLTRHNGVIGAKGSFHKREVESMCKCKGFSVMTGVAIGPIHFYQRPARQYDMTPCEDPAEELERMEQARKQAIMYQSELYAKALKEAGAEIATVFDVHALMLDDKEFVETARENIVDHHMRASYAVRCAAYAMVDRFAGIEDEYLKARIDDILDMARGVIYLLQGGVQEPKWEEPAIILAEDFSPSETVQMDKDTVLGFATHLGSNISHTAILARSMDLPALVGVKDLQPEWEGKMAILDGLTGELIVSPDVDTLVKYRRMQKEIAHRKKLLERLKGRSNVTIDGHHVEVMANVDKPEDVEMARENDAGGIGQFRSDYLFLGQGVIPDEESQFQCYKKLVQNMRPHPVQIATVDWGTPVPSRYLNITREERVTNNYRGIRRSLMEPEVFRVQLRAILRAAAFGEVRVMLPMVTSVQEVQCAREILESCRKDLIAEGAKIGDVKLGLVIETPAAVWIADELAQEVDFFMLGTNDLIQYTCVLDRDNMEQIPYADPYHPAIMRAIAEVIKIGHHHGIPVGICGELGGDIDMTEHFLRLGMDSFSVAPNMVLSLRNHICHLDLREPANPVPTWKSKL